MEQQIKKSHHKVISELDPVIRFRMMRQFKKVCELYQRNPKEVYLLNKMRFRDLVEIRQVAFCVIRKKHPDYTYNKIAFFFQKENHATVLHGLKTISNLRETNKKFRNLTDPLFN